MLSQELMAAHLSRALALCRCASCSICLHHACAGTVNWYAARKNLNLLMVVLGGQNVLYAVELLYLRGVWPG